MEMQLHCSFVLSLPYQVYYDSAKKFSFNNVNLCGSNVVKMFELNFCYGERKLFTYLHRR